MNRCAPDSASGRRFRSIEVARACWGAALLVSPKLVLEQVHGVKVDRASLVVARVLGARQLGQAALSGISPSPEVLAMGVWVDSVHAASAVALAGLDRDRFRAGATDAAVASLWALAGYRDLRRGRPTPPAHERHRDQLARLVLRVVPGGSRLLRRVAAVRSPQVESTAT